MNNTLAWSVRETTFATVEQQLNWSVLPPPRPYPVQVKKGMDQDERLDVLSKEAFRVTWFGQQARARSGRIICAGGVGEGGRGEHLVAVVMGKAARGILAVTASSPPAPTRSSASASPFLARRMDNADYPFVVQAREVLRALTLSVLSNLTTVHRAIRSSPPPPPPLHSLFGLAVAEIGAPSRHSSLTRVISRLPPVVPVQLRWEVVLPHAARSALPSTRLPPFMCFSSSAYLVPAVCPALHARSLPAVYDAATR